MSIYSSRAPFNDDPKPYECSQCGDRDWQANDKYYEFAPRPEYNRPQNNPTNRILIVARRAKRDGRLADFCKGFLSERNTEHAEIDHAQRVLIRWTSLEKEES